MSDGLDGTRERFGDLLRDSAEEEQRLKEWRDGSHDEEIKGELLEAAVALNKAMKKARDAEIKVSIFVKDFSIPFQHESVTINMEGWGVFHQINLGGSRTKITSPW